MLNDLSTPSSAAAQVTEHEQSGNDGAGLFCPGSSVAADVCGFAQHGGESREI